ncbi:YfbU family protein [Rhodanobacter sp. OK091]|uniref:YfbU family protein n=1 Tax=Rhodanobacter sp. OK091 TaxID=1881037 RepID=UPI0009211AA0|nr:YfbU family protein [Rhodanobacter sp. OK091]SHL63318.1 hypothetical protein SAMN05428972_0445 [Rhodanobacter sp. OK091]
MQFTNEQKLIAAMLAEVHQTLKIRDGVNSELVAKALFSGNEWAIEWEHGFLLDQNESPPHVKHVVDVLDMWSFIESAYGALKDADKKRFADGANFNGKPSFPGFDGNNEAEYLSAARFMIEEMRRFGSFKGRADLNSHHPTLDTSKRMLEVFLPIRASLGVAGRPLMSADDLIAVFHARKHPGNRAA